MQLVELKGCDVPLGTWKSKSFSLAEVLQERRIKSLDVWHVYGIQLDCGRGGQGEEVRLCSRGLTTISQLEPLNNFPPLPLDTGIVFHRSPHILTTGTYYLLHPPLAHAAATDGSSITNTDCYWRVSQWKMKYFPLESQHRFFYDQNTFSIVRKWKWIIPHFPLNLK